MAGLILANPPWLGAEGIAELCAALDGQARFVGGCVRDALAGQSPKDIDLATPVPVDEVITRFAAAAIKCKPTGLAHGTVTAILPSGPVEVTTLRRDVATDGRRATIAYTDDWREDAARRDFTINALYADPVTSEVTDYFGGADDLAAGLVRFIGDPLARIAEDHLRILRYFRFHARYGKGEPDAASLAACAVRANDLMALSRERIALEMTAILSLPDPVPVIQLMLDHAILKPVLPEIADIDALVRLISREAGHHAPEPIRRLAALLPPDASIAEAVANRLRLSNVQRKSLMALAARSPDDGADPKALAYWHGTSIARDRLLLGDGDARSLAGFNPPRFPLSGGILVARGIKAGPEVARLLKSIEQKWVNAGFPEANQLDQIMAETLSAG